MGPTGTPNRVVLGAPQELANEMTDVRSQLDDLRRRDAEKERQIEELRRHIERRRSDSVLRRSAPPVDASIKLCGLESIDPEPRNPAQESALDKAVRDLEKQQESPLDRAVKGLPPTPGGTQSPTLLPGAGGGAQLQLLDVSFDVLFAAGTSTEREASLEELEGGGHDPHKRGFTLQNAELFLGGAVDPYIDAGANIIFFIDPEGETVVELEEAYVTTRSLPCGLQLKAGQFFTEFGRLNPRHPHQWHWQDQPVINTRLFGPDGMRGPGVRLNWLVPVEWFSQVYVGMQNANGETMSSFLASEEFFAERPVGGRPFVDRDVRALNDVLYLVRWENSWTSCDDEVTWLAGVSGVFGPNATGPDGHTEIYGTDLTMKWKPATTERGWPFIVWESEIMNRHYVADNFTDLGDPIDPLDDVILSGETLRDWGFYTQVLHGCRLRWAVGIRYEFVHGNGPSLDENFAQISRDDDPFRDTRHRVAPLVAWHPTEFSRFRFQYNFDYADHIGGMDAHSFWIGAEWLYGAHSAHKF
jgi:hypothetical protein